MADQDDQSPFDATPEPDRATADMFGAPVETPPAAAAHYTVIARKYRPSSFAELIGHDTLVRTLKNAFESGRIAHAFMLTGVRGVGKTTTARIIAKALNCTGPDGTGGLHGAGDRSRSGAAQQQSRDLHQLRQSA